MGVRADSVNAAIARAPEEPRRNDSCAKDQTKAKGLESGLKSGVEVEGWTACAIQLQKEGTLIPSLKGLDFIHPKWDTYVSTIGEG